MISKRVLLALLFVVAVWTVSSPEFLGARELTVVGRLSPSTTKLLSSHGVRVQSSDTLTTLELRDRHSTLSLLAEALYANAAETAIATCNIRNARTLRTMAGTPYRRLEPVYGEDGSFLGAREVLDDYNWLYDPGHHEARDSGPHAGYVAYPSVRPGEERARIACLQKAGELLKDLIREVDPSVVVAGYHLEATDLPRLPARDVPHTQVNFSFLDDLRVCSPDWGDRTGLPFNKDFLVKEHEPTSSGQASVAVALNWLGGKPDWDDSQINERYGFALLDALNYQSRPLGWDWSDAGNINNESWGLIEGRLQRNLPVVVALNGKEPPFKGGYIITLLGCDPEKTLRYADPATGTVKSISWEKLVAAPSHPDGNFVFVPSPMGAGPRIEL